MASPQIEVVQSSRQRDEFAAFPWAVYEGDPYWVPSLFWDRRRFVDPKHNPFFEHSDVRLFIARQGGKVVGTVAGIVNHNHNAYLQRPGRWAGTAGRRLGLRQGLGHDGGGRANEHVHQRRMRSSDRRFRFAAGRDDDVKAMDLYAYVINVDLYGEHAENMPNKIVQGAEKLLRDGVVTVRKAQMSSFEDELVRAKQVYNSAWGRNWGFVPMTDAEIEHLARGLKHLIDPDMVFFAEHEGRPVGLAVALPDVNEALLRVYPRPGGFLRFVYDGVRFLWAKRTRPRFFRLLIMGVIEEYRNRGIDGVFYVEVAKATLAKGYRLSEMSWILENNIMMNRILQRLGGRVYKTYRVYSSLQ